MRDLSSSNEIDVPLAICAVLSDSRGSDTLQYMGNRDSFVKNDKCRM